jgi:alpha/beta hydrolase fold
VCQSAKHSGLKIALQVLLCPATDIARDTQSRREFAEGYFLEGPLMSWAGTHYLPSGFDVTDPRLSPLRAPDPSRMTQTSTPKPRMAAPVSASRHSPSHIETKSGGVTGVGNDGAASAPFFVAKQLQLHQRQFVSVGSKRLSDCDAKARPPRA